MLEPYCDKTAERQVGDYRQNYKRKPIRLNGLHDETIKHRAWLSQAEILSVFPATMWQHLIINQSTLQEIPASNNMATYNKKPVNIAGNYCQKEKR